MYQGCARNGDLGFTLPSVRLLGRAEGILDSGARQDVVFGRGFFLVGGGF